MDIMEILENLTTQEWIVIGTIFILLVCVVWLFIVRRRLLRELHKHMIPELMLDLDVDNFGLFLINEGSLVARNIQIDQVSLTLEDYGFKLYFILNFDEIESLPPKEKIKLEFKVYRTGEDKPVDAAEKIIAHLVSLAIKFTIHCANIHGVKFSATYFKDKEKKKFSLERLVTY